MTIEKCYIEKIESGVWKSGGLTYERIPTKNGDLVFYHIDSWSTKFPFVGVCGYFQKEEEKDGLTIIDVETIPKEQREEVEKLIRKKGYKSNLYFWNCLS